MGLFSGITDALSGITGAIGDVVDPVQGLLGGGLSFLGQQSANSANAALAMQQEEFQADMSGTAYQRAVADMKAAGLNPMLAYSQGGASTPSGAMPIMQNSLGAAVSSGAQAQQAQASLQQVNSQTALNKALAIKAGADAQASLSSAGAANAVAANTRQNTQKTAPEAAVANSWIGRNLPYFDRTMQSLGHLNPFVSSASSAKNAFSPEP